jgi:ubiquitin-protein ligase
MNINEEGYICLDILSERKWRSEITVGQILLSICNLLSHPNPDDPLDWDKRQVFVRDRIEYSKLCQAWTRDYAKSK